MSFQSQAFKKMARQHSATFPAELRQLSTEEIQTTYGRAPRGSDPDEFWRSRTFMAQVYYLADDVVRMSVNRTDTRGRQWRDSISWEELQMLKHQCGRGDLEAVEVFPPDNDVVNVSNMRHLFILPERLPFSWKREGADRG